MGLGMGYGNQLSTIGDNIGTISTSTNTMKGAIALNYKGQDANALMNALDQIKTEMNSIKASLGDESNNVIRATNEVNAEEEAERLKKLEEEQNQDSNTYGSTW